MHHRTLKLARQPATLQLFPARQARDSVVLKRTGTDEADVVLAHLRENDLRGEPGPDIKRAFEQLGANVAEVKPDNLAGAAAARWLNLSPQQRESAGLMAPSQALRQEINAIVRERLGRDGQVKGPALETERLISGGYTDAEKFIAANYSPGDVVGFHRPYKRLGVERGDELRVAEIDRETGTVNLRRKDGGIVGWIPHKLAARSDGVGVYRSESIELRQGDRIRWTRNDNGLGLINS